MRDVASDHAGNIYLAGGTDSRDFPTTQGVAQPALAGGTDVFVMKLDPQGRLLWSTLLGGPSDDRAYALEVDAEGYVYLGGRAGAGFPVTAGAFQTEFRGGPPVRGVYPSQSGFVAKLSPDGRRVLFASYVGAFDDPSHPVRDIALTADGQIYACTSTSTGNYPAAVRAAFRGGALSSRPGDKDGVVLKLKGDGSRVVWATFLGGSSREQGECSIRSGPDNSVTYMAVTTSPDAPTTPGAYDRTLDGPSDFYVVRLPADGSRLLWATYLGGSGPEDTETHGLAVDAAGHSYVVGGSTSTDFPTTAGALQRTYRGAGGQGTGARSNHQGDAVVAKLSGDGRRLLAATYVGGRFGDAGEGVGLDARGNVYF
ncbi:MAG TPA: SBBP repeat-containing protein, partial [Methylomirabilota bacterium]|nr:SBBP repeat-containing protein [Methylomirabilota bacterium]